MRPNAEGASAADLEAVVRWERDSIESFLSRMGATEPLFQGIDEFLRAGTPEEALRSLQRHPELVSDRGEAAFEVVLLFAAQTGMVVLPSALERRREWLRDLRASGWGQAKADGE
jgi:hypothetical protein